MKAPMYVSRSGAAPSSESLPSVRATLRRATACALTMLLLCNAALGASAAQAAKRPAPKVVKVTEAKPSAAKAAEEGRVSFTLTVKGEGFGTSADAVSLMLLNADGEDAVASDGTTVESAAPTKIVAHVVASPGPYSLRLKIGKANADTSALGPLAVVTAAGGETQQIAAQPVAPAQPGGIEIETPEAYAHPSDSGLKRYSLVVKRKSGEYFATDPKLVSLVLIPAGASDVTIRRVTPTRIEADFWAPDKYQIKDAGVTVYDRNNPQLIAASSDIEVKDGDTKDKNNAKNSNVNATASNEKGSADDVEPAITSTAVVFLQRAYGIGRLKIEGKNFGNYKAPPISAEDYLLCFEPLARQALYRALEESKHPDIKAQQAYEDQRCVLSNSPKTVKTSADKGASDADKSGADKNGSTLEQWRTWRAEIEKRVKVALVPKNTDLRIEQTKILYVDDKLIDVYFEFNRYFRNSEPLRLASATVTVKKPEQQKQEKKQQATNGQTVASSGNGADGTNVINAAMITNSSSGEKKDAPKSEPKEPDCDLGPCKTYIASSDVGATQGLEYTYNVLDNESSAMLFGKGVAGNFYAILLSVTNNGDRKISIPLSSIRAEIEWAYGSGDSKSGKGSKAAKANDNDSTATESDDKDSSTAKQGVKKSANGTLDAMSYVDADDSTTATPIRIPSAPSLTTYYYEEGPVTLAPLSLQTVTAFFDGDEKVNGKKAKLFNYFDGAAILGSSLFPFFGPGFRDAHGAFTGGLIPGLKRGLGDLSGQQLQNLTGMSWQDIEVVGAKGGSVVKYIFIQRGDSSFSPGFNESIKKTIKNIQGMEVKGIEVIEGDTKTAAHTGQQ